LQRSPTQVNPIPFQEENEFDIKKKLTLTGLPREQVLRERERGCTNHSELKAAKIHCAFSCDASMDNLINVIEVRSDIPVS